MGGTVWRRTRTAPLVFAGTTGIVLLAAIVLLNEVRGGGWVWVVAGSLVFGGVSTLISATALPVAVAFNGDGVRLRYLHRREGLMWEQVQHLHVVEGSILLETSHRTIDLGSLAYPVRKDLVAAARLRGRQVRADRPEDYEPPPDEDLGIFIS